MNTNLKWIAALLYIAVIATGCEKSNKGISAEGFELSEVRINDGPFLKAQKADLDYILALDVDRLLAPFIKDAGIKPLKDNYGNWENTGLDGHIGGHYMSALSFMYAATANPELLQRIEYMITWIGRCQDKNGNGYVGGIPYGQKIWKEISEGKINAGTFSLNDRWVPLYNIHKLFAGLVDVYNITGNEEAKQILIKLSNWFYNTTKNLSDEQMQTILISEHGGMNEVFVDVAAISDDAKFMELANRLSHRAILNPLLDSKNELTGLHANTQIPKVIGFEKYALATQNKSWADAAKFFWDIVINDWTISIGGNSVREHFHPANDFSSMVESEQGPETCNTYNMLKLTKLLYLANPESKYMDYYERALFNHILSSEHPDKGGFVYFTPMRPRHYRVYSQAQTSFWCCVGSGLENPGRYGEMIYAKSEDELYVNLFIASEVKWSEKGISLVQETKFPDEEGTQMTIHTDKAKRFSLKLRHPKWITDESFKISINGEDQSVKTCDEGYVCLKRTWKNDDVVKLNFNMKTYTEFMPDSSHWVSFLHGPIVLGAITDTMNLDGLWADDSRMGHAANGEQYPLDKAPALVVDDFTKLSEMVIHSDSQPMHFTLSNLLNMESGNMKLQPFYTIHEARYMVYWPVYNKEEFSQMQKNLAQQEQEIMELNQRTVDLVWPGEQQPESDHFIKFKNSNTGIHKNKHWRDASGWFSYELKNVNKEPVSLRVTYYGLDNDRAFKILINSNVIAEVNLDGSHGNEFFDVDYDIPAEILNTSAKMELKFVANENSLAGGVFGVRLMRKK